MTTAPRPDSYAGIIARIQRAHELATELASILDGLGWDLAGSAHRIVEAIDEELRDGE